MNRADILEMIQLYLEAEKSVLAGKTITFNGQQMSQENLAEIIKGREKWERRLNTLNSSRRGQQPFKLARFK